MIMNFILDKIHLIFVGIMFLYFIYNFIIILYLYFLGFKIIINCPIINCPIIIFSFTNICSKKKQKVIIYSYFYKGNEVKDIYI